MNYPKRRKNKDNPYTIAFDEKNNKYTVSFLDAKGILRCIKIGCELYNVFNNFELIDLSQLNEFDRHIEHLNIMESDEIMFKRIIDKGLLTDEIAERNLTDEKLLLAIKELPKLQQRRLIKYYFREKNLEEIALEEGCSKVAVKYSIDNAIANLRKKLKK